MAGTARPTRIQYYRQAVVAVNDIMAGIRTGLMYAVAVGGVFGKPDFFDGSSVPGFLVPSFPIFVFGFSNNIMKYKIEIISVAGLSIRMSMNRFQYHLQAVFPDGIRDIQPCLSDTLDFVYQQG